MKFTGLVLIICVYRLCLSGTNGQYLGETCIVVQNNLAQRGRCVFAENCPYAIQLIRENRRPGLCGFEGKDPIVCCPGSKEEEKQKPTSSKPPTQPLKTTISEQKCRQFSNSLFINKNRLQFTTTVVGGVEATAKEFPHMAALGYGTENDVQWLCGGSLISEEYVLTAAHCLYSREYGQVKYIRVGDLNLQSRTDDAQPQNFIVSEVIPHPNYKPPSQYNDIALIKLDRPATFTVYVKPACLQTEFNLPLNEPPVATGWGRLDFGGESSDQLMKVNLSYFSNEQCKNIYANIRKSNLANGIDNELQLCAGGLNESKDTCQGDSGGPLQIKNQDNSEFFNIIGITSFGKGCGIQNVPGVYTRVSSYIPWIESIVWPN